VTFNFPFVGMLCCMNASLISAGVAMELLALMANFIHYQESGGRCKR